MVLPPGEVESVRVFDTPEVALAFLALDSARFQSDQSAERSINRFLTIPALA